MIALQLVQVQETNDYAQKNVTSLNNTSIITSGRYCNFIDIRVFLGGNIDWNMHYDIINNYIYIFFK